MDEIIANLVDNKRLEEEAMEYVSKEVSEAIKIKQMELQFEREEQEKEMQIREKKLQKKKSVTERNYRKKTRYPYFH